MALGRIILFALLITEFGAVTAQKRKLVIADFDLKTSTSGWWRDNRHVKFTYEEKPENQPSILSKKCLHVRWDSISNSKPFTWFTDLKADTFAVEGMQKEWKNFKQNTWISFWYKVGTGDSLMFHYLVLSKGHTSKWGAKKMTAATATKWTFVKVKFADLQYDNWGKITADFDLNSDAVKCFEIGLRSSATSPKGYIEAWFDDIVLTNYEPFE
jgi:hypothetical protein